MATRRTSAGPHYRLVGPRASFGRRGGVSLSRQASPPRFSQLTLKVPHLLAGTLGDVNALKGIAPCRLSLLCEAFTLGLFTGLLRRCLFARAP